MHVCAMHILYDAIITVTAWSVVTVSNPHAYMQDQGCTLPLWYSLCCSVLCLGWCQVMRFLWLVAFIAGPNGWTETTLEELETGNICLPSTRVQSALGQLGLIVKLRLVHHMIRLVCYTGIPWQLVTYLGYTLYYISASCNHASGLQTPWWIL